MNTTNYFNDNKAVAQFVEDSLPQIKEGSQWIIVIRPEKSGEYSAIHVTEKRSEGIRWQRWAPSEVLSLTSKALTQAG